MNPYEDNNSQGAAKQVIIKDLVLKANAKLKSLLNNDPITNPNQVIVQIFLIFLRIGEIDNIKERFQADAYIEASWEDNTVDTTLGYDPHQYWKPEIHIENALGNLTQDIRYKVERNGDRTKIFEMRNIKGFFWERLELWDFPLGKIVVFFFK